VPKDTFYDAISEEPLKMVDEFIESAFEGIASLFKDTPSSRPSSKEHLEDHRDSRSGGGGSGGGCTCCSWFCRCR
jgi:hypothetical protein